MTLFEFLITLLTILSATWIGLHIYYNYLKYKPTLSSSEKIKEFIFEGGSSNP